MPIRRDAARGPAVLLLLLSLASLVTACEVSAVEPLATSQATRQVALSTGVRALPAYIARLSPGVYPFSPTRAASSAV